MRKLITLFIILLLLFLLVLTLPKEVTSTNETRKPQTKPEIIEAYVPIVIVAEIEAKEYVPPPPQSLIGLRLGPSAIAFLGACESGNDPTKNTGNSFYGNFQFSIRTWDAMQTDYVRADLAPYSVQVNAVHKLLSQADIFKHFSDCAKQMRAEGLI